MIPLYENKGHKLVSLTGKKSKFFEVIPLDIEGLDSQERELIFNQLEKALFTIYLKESTLISVLEQTITTITAKRTR